MGAKEYSWAYVTTSGKLTDGPAELVSAELIPSGATTDTVIYNGTSNKGDPVVTLKRSSVDNYSFAPPVPIPCYKGIYITVGSSVTAVLVQWRETHGE